MARDYANMIDYVRTQLDTFDGRGPCRVDSLVFSWLSYLRIPSQAVAARSSRGMALKDLCRPEWMDALCGKLYDPVSSAELLCAVAQSPRFRDVLVCGYVSHTNERVEQQFSAMTFVLGPQATFVAFRGTDNTLVGWKEDFNMAFAPVVPSQLEAVRYLEGVAAQTRGRLWCGGHSKGGNLAVYAGVMCDPRVQTRLATCFSHDGPGFGDAAMADARWSIAETLVDKTIPQSSVIGMAFERQERGFMVVRSHARGLAQHDPFSWEVEGRDFACVRKVRTGVSLLDASLNAWLQQSAPADRERFIDTVFVVLRSSGQETFADMRDNWKTAIPRMALAVAMLDPEDRKFVQQAVMGVGRALWPERNRGERRQPVGDGEWRRLMSDGATGLLALMGGKQE